MVPPCFHFCGKDSDWFIITPAPVVNEPYPECKSVNGLLPNNVPVIPTNGMNKSLSKGLIRKTSLLFRPQVVMRMIR